jgi:hypothetical protein
MQRDIKDVLGVLMHVLDGGEISSAELDELGFEADDDELEQAVNETYVTLAEFVKDRELRQIDRELDRKMRSSLQECLDRIVRICDRLDGVG